MVEAGQVHSAAVLDGQRIVRDYMSSVLKEAGFEVAVAGEGAEALAPPWAVEVAVLGLDPEERCGATQDGVAALRQVRSQQPRARLVVLAANDRPELAERCYQEGAAVVLSKRTASREDLLAAVRVGVPRRLPGAQAAVVGLTPRQREVLSHVGQGHDNLKIAALLDITEHTVKAHMVAIYRKVRMENRVELALLARELSPAR